MDPNTKLQQMIERARLVRAIEDAPDEAVQLADDIEELHQWLMNGGFLPAAWTRTPEDNSTRVEAVQAKRDETVQTHRTGGRCTALTNRVSAGNDRCVLEQGHYGDHNFSEV